MNSMTTMLKKRSAFQIALLFIAAYCALTVVVVYTARAQCTTESQITLPTSTLSLGTGDGNYKKVCVSFNLTAVYSPSQPCNCKQQGISPTWRIVNVNTGQVVCASSATHDPCQDIQTGDCNYSNDCCTFLYDTGIPYRFEFIGAQCYTGTINVCFGCP